METQIFLSMMLLFSAYVWFHNEQSYTYSIYHRCCLSPTVLLRRIAKRCEAIWRVSEGQHISRQIYAWIILLMYALSLKLIASEVTSLYNMDPSRRQCCSTARSLFSYLEYLLESVSSELCWTTETASCPPNSSSDPALLCVHYSVV